MSKVMGALKVLPTKRTLNDLVAITSKFRDLNIFDRSDDDAGGYERMITNLASSVFYAHCKKDQFVFQEDSKGDFFYIIVEGRVRLVFGRELSDMPELEEEIGRSQKEHISDSIKPMSKKFNIQSPLKMSLLASTSEPKKFHFDPVTVSLDGELDDIEDETSSKINMYRVLKEGDTFGEMAMLIRDAKRSCGIKAMQDCHLAVIHKSQYNKMLSRSL